MGHRVREREKVMSTAKNTMDGLALKLERTAGALSDAKQVAVAARDQAETLGKDAKEALRQADMAKRAAKNAKGAVKKAKSSVKKAESKLKEREAREAKKLRADAKSRARDARHDLVAAAVQPQNVENVRPEGEPEKLKDMDVT